MNTAKIQTATLRTRAGGHWAVIGAPYVWVLLFVLLPLLVVLDVSFSVMGTLRPNDLLSVRDGTATLTLRFAGYQVAAQDAATVAAYVASLKYAFWTALLCLVIGYPFAYLTARSRPAVRLALLMLVMLPWWTSLLLRVYAWKGLLSPQGWVWDIVAGLGLDPLLFALGMIAAPGQLMHTPFSLVLGMVCTYLPVMILPLVLTLSKLDLRLLEAAQDLGATPWAAFWKVTVPLSKAGIVAGSMLVFIPCAGEFVIPELLGGPQTPMIGQVMWNAFFAKNDWPMAATLAVMMILTLLLPLAIFIRTLDQAQERRP